MKLILAIVMTAGLVLGSALTGIGMIRAHTRAVAQQTEQLRALREEMRGLRREPIAGDARCVFGTDLSALGAEIDRRLAAARSAGFADNGTPPAERAPPSAEQAVALQRANGVLGEAFSHRRWDDSNAHDLRALLGELADGDRHEVLRQLSVAINEGRVRVETAGSPL